MTDEIKDPGIDISSWDSIFRSLLPYEGFIIIENEFDGDYYIGKISRVCRSHILFGRFDADGIWQEEPVLIPFSSITHVAWDTRYTNNWYNYLNG